MVSASKWVLRHPERELDWSLERIDRVRAGRLDGLNVALASAVHKINDLRNSLTEENQMQTTPVSRLVPPQVRRSSIIPFGAWRRGLQAVLGGSGRLQHKCSRRRWHSVVQGLEVLEDRALLGGLTSFFRRIFGRNEATIVVARGRCRSLHGAIIFSVLLLSLNSPLRASPFLYVSQYTDGGGSGLGVVSVDSTGAASPFATFNPTGFASQMAFDRSGNILVANTHQGNILKVTPSGAVSVFATGAGEPDGLVRANDGSFYYTSNAGGNSIEKISLTGVVTPFVSLPAGSFPQWLVLDKSGNLLVSNTVGKNIDIISPSGTITTLATGIAEPEGLAFNQSGTLFVADYSGKAIDEVTTQGLVIPFVTGLPGTPTDIVFDQSGNLFVSLYAQNSILEISPTGAVSPFSAGIVGADGLLLASPEPSSLILVGTSLAILPGYCWRRRKLARQRGPKVG